MNLAIIAIAAYGLLNIVGGIIGYTKSNSKISLISGSISGALLLIMAALHARGMAGALLAAQLIVIALIIVFALRLRKTRKFMPAGLMILSGGLVVSVLLLA